MLTRGSNATRLILVILACGGVLAAQSPSLHFQVDGSPLGAQRLGYSVSEAGDVDADGHGDIIVGAPAVSVGGAGNAFVFSGANGVLLHSWGLGVNSQFGFSVSGAGDVNGDGLDDLIVGAPTAGTAYVYSGMNGNSLHQWTGPLTNDRFGWSVTDIGDVDADGYDDVAVGAPGVLNVTPLCPPMVIGRVYVFSGLSGTLIRTLIGSFIGDRFGYEVSRAGDVDGDGVDDLIVQNYQLDLFMYSGQTGGLLYSLPIFLLTSSDGCGDVNGDGFDDFVVGTDIECSGWLGAPPGQVTVRSDPTGSVLYQLTAPAGSLGFGYSVSGTGDLDGDGIGDLVVGAPGGGNLGSCGTGQAYIYSGASGTLLYQLSGSISGTRYGYSVSGAGDVNRDGFQDIIVGEYAGAPGGRASVYTVPPVPPGSCAAGNVNGNGAGGITDVLGIGFTGSGGPSYGLPGRAVVIPPFSASIDLWMAVPPANPGPTPYIVFGTVESGYAGLPSLLPAGIGSACFAPQILDPGGPALFMVGDTAGLTWLLLPPATVQGPGSIFLAAAQPPFALTFTLQGVIQDVSAASGFSVTNAVRVVVP